MEISNDQVMLSYTDNIVVVVETKEEVINAIPKFINASKGKGLHISEEGKVSS